MNNSLNSDIIHNCKRRHGIRLLNENTIQKLATTTLPRIVETLCKYDPVTLFGTLLDQERILFAVLIVICTDKMPADWPRVHCHSFIGIYCGHFTSTISSSTL